LDKRELEMSMNILIFYVVVADSGLIMAGGAASAFVVLMGWDASKFWERVWPATACLVASNFVAVGILWVASKFT
jgi:hypothetical protein